MRSGDAEQDKQGSEDTKPNGRHSFLIFSLFFVEYQYRACDTPLHSLKPLGLEYRIPFQPKVFE